MRGGRFWSEGLGGRYAKCPQSAGDVFCDKYVLKKNFPYRKYYFM